MKINAKYVVFTVIAIMSTYVLYHNERFLIDSSHPAWQHYESFKWWLLPHGVFGAIVLLFAPLQFSDRLRQRFTKAHRVMGRLYVVGALGLAPLGAYIQYYQERMGAPRCSWARRCSLSCLHSSARSHCIDSGPLAVTQSHSYSLWDDLLWV